MPERSTAGAEEGQGGGRKGHQAADPAPDPPPAAPAPRRPAAPAAPAGRPSAFELDIGGIIAKSTVMAVLFAVPPICIFLALHHYTGNVLAAAAAGFGVHFAILAISPRIAELLIAGGRSGRR